MHGWQSLNLEFTPLDPNLERNLRRSLRARAEMGDNQKNQIRRSMKNSMMQELGTESKEELMTWISLHHSGNFSHQLRLVPICA
jgi:hypothetical protein